MNTIVLVVLFLCFLTVPVYAQSTIALEEKCAEIANKFFFGLIESYGGKWGFFDNKSWGHGYNDFTSHYNKKLDKCFIRIEFHSFTDETEQAIDIIDVWNVFEGTRIAHLSTPVKLPIDCAVAGETCNSPWEFEALIKPYMEE
jgi:hypothetical protein